MRYFNKKTLRTSKVWLLEENHKYNQKNQSLLLNYQLIQIRF